MDRYTAELLGVLRRRAAAAARLAEPVPAEVLVGFLPRWHGIGAPAARLTGPEGVSAALARLEGVVLPAAGVEADLLASRMGGYEARWMDDLCSAGGICWVGAGEGRLVFARREVAGEIFPLLGLAGAASPDLGGPLHARIREVLAGEGSAFFRDLGGSRHADEEVLGALWDLVWGGEVTCDGYSALRAVAASRRRSPGGAAATRSGGGSGVALRPRPRLGSLRASGPLAGQGRWSLVSRLVGEPAPSRRGEVAMVEALLERYGILTSEVVRAEGLPGGSAGLQEAMLAMEGHGLALTGRFVAGAGDVQLARPEALELLRDPAALLRGAHVISAVDPANAYGAVVPWPVPGPSRVAGAYVVLLEGVGSLYIDRGGRGLVALRALDGTWEEAAVATVATRVGAHGGGPAWRRLALRRYPDELAPLLRSAGFVPTPKGLTLYG